MRAFSYVMKLSNHFHKSSIDAEAISPTMPRKESTNRTNNFNRSIQSRRQQNSKKSNFGSLFIKEILVRTVNIKVTMNKYKKD